MATDLDLAEVQKSNIAKSAAETLLKALGGTHIYVRVRLVFFPAYVPAANEAISVRYRGQGTSVGRVRDAVSVAAAGAAATR